MSSLTVPIPSVFFEALTLFPVDTFVYLGVPVAICLYFFGRLCSVTLFGQLVLIICLCAAYVFVAFSPTQLAASFHFWTSVIWIYLGYFVSASSSVAPHAHTRQSTCWSMGKALSLNLSPFLTLISFQSNSTCPRSTPAVLPFIRSPETYVTEITGKPTFHPSQTPNPLRRQ